MPLGKKALEMERNFESKGLMKIKATSASISDLDELLISVYETRRPKLAEYESRRALIQTFNVITKDIYGNRDDCPYLEEYGSFVMDMFSSGSDLDLSVNFSNNTAELSRLKKIEALRKFAKKFKSLRRQGLFTRSQPILTARVPIVKVIDQKTGIECDFSIENRDGVAKSQIIYIISTIDERFRKLSFLMKAWAKSHDINSSRDHTLNSLSVISMVAFHLQTRNPPILPPFSALLKGGADPVNVKKMVEVYLNNGQRLRNEESLGKLFVALLIKLESYEKCWREGLCASLYEGSWISQKWDTEISIEDFSDRSQNVSRAVTKAGAVKIYRCIHRSFHHLGAFFSGQNYKKPEFLELLFGTADGCSYDLDNNNESVGGRKRKQREEDEHPAQGQGSKKLPKVRGRNKLKKDRRRAQQLQAAGGSQVVQSWLSNATTPYPNSVGPQVAYHNNLYRGQIPAAPSYGLIYNHHAPPTLSYPSSSGYPLGVGPNHNIGFERSDVYRHQPCLQGPSHPDPTHGPIYGRHGLNHQYPSTHSPNPVGGLHRMYEQHMVHPSSQATMQSSPGLIPPPPPPPPPHGPIYGRHGLNHQYPSNHSPNPVRGLHRMYEPHMAHPSSQSTMQSSPVLIPPPPPPPPHGPIYGRHGLKHQYPSNHSPNPVGGLHRVYEHIMDHPSSQATMQSSPGLIPPPPPHGLVAYGRQHAQNHTYPGFETSYSSQHRLQGPVLQTSSRGYVYEQQHAYYGERSRR